MLINPVNACDILTTEKDVDMSEISAVPESEIPSLEFYA